MSTLKANKRVLKIFWLNPKGINFFFLIFITVNFELRNSEKKIYITRTDFLELVNLRLKFDLVLHPALAEGLVNHHHHHVVPLARISLILPRHFSQSFIASDRSSGLHPVSSHSCYMYFRAGRPAFARPYVGVQRSTSLMSSSLLLQQCPACLVRLAWIVFVMGGKWPYSWCLVGCCHQDLFNIARSILV